MKLRSTLVNFGVCAAFVLGASLTVSASAEHVAFDVRIGVAPPPMRVEHIPHARHGYMWVSGYWAWRGGRHIWIDGYWERERPGFRFIQARWVLVDGAWAFYPGYWEQAPAPVVVVQSPPVYIEQQQAAPQFSPPPAPPPSVSQPQQFDPNFWYYCRNPAGYYPYVKECSGEWQKVTPVPH